MKSLPRIRFSFLHSLFVISLLGLGALSFVVASQYQQNVRTKANTAANVTITGIAGNNSSAKVSFSPVPGAVDYRIYDLYNPGIVKYAGKVYRQNGTETATSIEWNLLGDNQEHTLVVEAVNALGPAPRGNQYDSTNQPMVQPLPHNAMLGGNAGPTADGKYSINGQGPHTNNPQVIAKSAPFTAKANSSLRAIPSGADATQTFFDRFSNDLAGTVQRTALNAAAGTMTYKMGNAPIDWNLFFRGVDTTASMPFILDDHFMEMVFDKDHTSYGHMSMSPNRTLDFSAGRIAHLTMEVDSHVSDNRWVGFELAPSSDPLTNWNPAERLNAANKAIFIKIFADCQVEFATGTKTDGSASMSALLGSSSQTACVRPQNGIGLDNRTRFDVFVSKDRIALFENGSLLAQNAIPDGWLPFEQAVAYFSHFSINSNAGRTALLQNTTYKDFWITEFPFSDERHWDNMGVEVLPASAAGSDWSALAARIQMPQNITPSTVPTPSVTFPPATVTPAPTMDHGHHLPTATPGASSAANLQFTVDVILHGIGSGGDNANPLGNAASNKNPKTPIQPVKLTVSNASNIVVANLTGTLLYSSQSGSFKGTVSSSSALPSGPYQVRVAVDRYLAKLYPGIQNLVSNQPAALAPITLVAGDSSRNNQLDIVDYNNILNCYGDIAAPIACTDAAKKKDADLTDDSSVNQYDYNLFLREISIQRGQ